MDRRRRSCGRNGRACEEPEALGEGLPRQAPERGAHRTTSHTRPSRGKGAHRNPEPAGDHGRRERENHLRQHRDDPPSRSAVRVFALLHARGCGGGGGRGARGGTGNRGPMRMAPRLLRSGRRRSHGQNGAVRGGRGAHVFAGQGLSGVRAGQGHWGHRGPAAP